MEDKSRIWGISDVKAFLISIITGFILLTIVAVIFTEISNETVNKTADRVLDFVQTRVNTYEYFIQNDKVKSLYRLSDKTQELVRCMQYEDDIDTFLDEYMYNQRLDGIVVLDGEGECEYCRGMEYTDIDSVIDDSNVKDVIEHPQKVYITRVNARSGSITYTESQNEEFSDIATQLKEVATPEFKQYCKQIKANAKALAKALMDKGYTVCTDGTDNHLILWDVRPLGLTGSKIEKVCDLINISLNKNTVHGDRSAQSPGGVRIGTPALTTRGLKEADFEKVAGFLDRAVKIALDVQKV